MKQNPNLIGSFEAFDDHMLATVVISEDCFTTHSDLYKKCQSHGSGIFGKCTRAGLENFKKVYELNGGSIHGLIGKTIDTAILERLQTEKDHDENGQNNQSSALIIALTAENPQVGLQHAIQQNSTHLASVVTNTVKHMKHEGGREGGNPDQKRLTAEKIRNFSAVLKETINNFLNTDHTLLEAIEYILSLLNSADVQFMLQGSPTAQDKHNDFEWLDIIDFTNPEILLCIPLLPRNTKRSLLAALYRARQSQHLSTRSLEENIAGYTIENPHFSSRAGINNTVIKSIAFPAYNIKTDTYSIGSSTTGMLRTGILSEAENVYADIITANNTARKSENTISPVIQKQAESLYSLAIFMRKNLKSIPTKNDWDADKAYMRITKNKARKKAFGALLSENQMELLENIIENINSLMRNSARYSLQKTLRTYVTTKKNEISEQYSLSDDVTFGHEILDLFIEDLTTRQSKNSAADVGNIMLSKWSNIMSGLSTAFPYLKEKHTADSGLTGITSGEQNATQQGSEEQTELVDIFAGERGDDEF